MNTSFYTRDCNIKAGGGKDGVTTASAETEGQTVLRNSMPTSDSTDHNEDNDGIVAGMSEMSVGFDRISQFLEWANGVKPAVGLHAYRYQLTVTYFNMYFNSNIFLDFLWRCCINIFCLIMIASLPWREDCTRVHLKICTRIQPPQSIRPLYLARTVASQVHLRNQFSLNRTEQKLSILGNISCPARHIIW